MSIRYARLKKMQWPSTSVSPMKARLCSRHRGHQGRRACLPRRCRSSAAGIEALRVDIGTRPPTVRVDVAAAEIAGHHPQGSGAVLGGDDRGAAVAAMSEAFAALYPDPQRYRRHHRHRRWRRHGDHHRGHARPAARPAQDHGLDARLRRRGALRRRLGHRDDAVGHRHGRPQPDLPRHPVERRARHIAAWRRRLPPVEGKPALGLTMFGVTTACVTAIADRLRDDYDCMVFHATGTGGRAMEKLADSGLLSGVHRHHDDRGLRLAVRRRAAGDERPLRRHRPHRRPLCRLGRRARHGEFLGAADGAGEISRPPALPAQSERDADAHVAGRVRRDRPLDRRQAQRLRRPGALSDPRERRVGARHRRRRLLRPGCRRTRCSTRSKRRCCRPAGDRLVRLPLHINDPLFAGAAVAAFREISKG